jgi:hypothetical protein
VRDVPLHIAPRVIVHCGVAHPFTDLLAGNTTPVAIELRRT